MTYNKEEIYEMVTRGVGEIGEGYLDWGVASEIYRNCPNREYANEVACRLKSEGSTSDEWGAAVGK